MDRAGIRPIRNRSEELFRTEKDRVRWLGWHCRYQPWHCQRCHCLEYDIESRQGRVDRKSAPRGLHRHRGRRLARVESPGWIAIPLPRRNWLESGRKRISRCSASPSLKKERIERVSMHANETSSIGKLKGRAWITEKKGQQRVRNRNSVPSHAPTIQQKGPLR